MKSRAKPILLYYLLLLSSCSIKIKVSSQISSCYKTYNEFSQFYEEPIGFKSKEEISLDSLLECTITLAHQGEPSAQDDILAYFNNLKLVYKNSGLELSYVAYDPYSKQVEIFGKMRGKEAFELALDYASESVNLSTTDDLLGGHLGFITIRKIVLPMIKSVDDKTSFYDYLNKNIVNSKKGLIENSEDIYQVLYENYLFELTHAWNCGLIKLKEYGED